MKNFREPKIKYYFNDRTVIAVCMYNGKRLRACAKCAPEDEYNKEYGMQLAKERVLKKWFKAKINKLAWVVEQQSISIERAKWKYNDYVNNLDKLYSEYYNRYDYED